MLNLRRCGVADTNRSIVPVTLKIRGNDLIHWLRRHDAENWPDIFLRSDAENERDEVFHRLGGAQAIQCLHDEVGVPQPAMSVVPIASRPRSFRYRSGERRDNPAGLFKIGK